MSKFSNWTPYELAENMIYASNKNIDEAIAMAETSKTIIETTSPSKSYTVEGLKVDINFIDEVIGKLKAVKKIDLEMKKAGDPRRLKNDWKGDSA
tara:strand:- start:85 stop:369 length:285 start_codon:yes stop_codon:yes gene_type:complete